MISSEQLAGLRGPHRERDEPGTLDLETQVLGARRQRHAERRLHVTAQRPGQPITQANVTGHLTTAASLLP